MLTSPSPLDLSFPEISAATLRVGIIGLGKIGRIHLSNLNRIEGVEIVAVAEPNEANRRGIDQKIQLCKSWSELVMDKTIDAVIITLPHSLHAECAEFALRHDKHVFLEKPLATTFEDALQLVKTSQDTGKTLMVNMTHRFYPPMQIARRMIQEGALGDLITVHDHYMEVIDRADFPAWFFDPSLAGGGVTMTDSIHLLDRVSWLIDEPLSLQGQVTRTLDAKSEVEDCSELICQSASGVPATVGSFFCFDSVKTWADRLTIFGGKGTLVVHAWSHLEWTPHGAPTQRIEGYPLGLTMGERAAIGHRAAMDEFLSSVRENRSPESAAHLVLNAQEIVQEFYDRQAPIVGTPKDHYTI